MERRDSATAEIDRDAFLQEWKAPLRRVVEALDEVKPAIVDDEAVSALRRIEAAIPRPGSLSAD